MVWEKRESIDRCIQTYSVICIVDVLYPNGGKAANLITKYALNSSYSVHCTVLLMNYLSLWHSIKFSYTFFYLQLEAHATNFIQPEIDIFIFNIRNKNNGLDVAYDHCSSVKQQKYRNIICTIQWQRIVQKNRVFTNAQNAITRTNGTKEEYTRTCEGVN